MRYTITALNETSELPSLETVSSVFLLAIADDTIVVTQDKERGWDIPGGHLEPGETIAQALAREAHEEAGITFTSAHAIATAKDDGSVPMYVGKMMLIFATNEYSLSEDFHPADDVAGRAIMKVHDFIEQYQGDKGTMKEILRSSKLFDK